MFHMFSTNICHDLLIATIGRNLFSHIFFTSAFAASGLAYCNHVFLSAVKLPQEIILPVIFYHYSITCVPQADTIATTAIRDTPLRITSTLMLLAHSIRKRLDFVFHFIPLSFPFLLFLILFFSSSSSFFLSLFPFFPFLFSSLTSLRTSLKARWPRAKKLVGRNILV